MIGLNSRPGHVTSGLTLQSPQLSFQRLQLGTRHADHLGGLNATCGALSSVRGAGWRLAGGAHQGPCPGVI